MPPRDGDNVQVSSSETWQRTIWTGVGGVLAVGVPDETRVVIGSHAGVGVLDASTGERVHRFRDSDYTWWHQDSFAIELRIPGSAPEHVSSMGLEGGSLPSTTPDGWSCQRSVDGATLTDGELRIAVVDAEEFRALGFSPAGSLFVYATSPNLTVLRRRTVHP